MDEDGVPDLLVGRATDGGGELVLRRGNIDTLFPNSPEARDRRSKGTGTSAAFLPASSGVELTLRPDALATADLDADGHLDVVTAAMGSNELLWLRGYGDGGLDPAEVIELPGLIAALLVADVNRRDGLADVLVAVNGEHYSWLYVFESPGGAFDGSEPEVLTVSGPITALAADRLEEDQYTDIVVAAGGELLLMHGRDRQLSYYRGPDKAAAAPVIEHRTLPHRVAALATGRFLGNTSSCRELAVLLDSGTLAALKPRPGLPFSDWPSRLLATYQIDLQQARREQARVALRTVNAAGGDDLLVLTGKAYLVSTAEQGPMEPQRVKALDDPLLDVLPMRLDRDALPDLVVVSGGRQRQPEVAHSKGVKALFVVDSAGDNSDANPGDGSCDTGLGSCTLRAAIEEANASAGADTIDFNIGGGGLQTIQPATALPQITEQVTIDGSTQPGFAGTPLIHLDGSLTPFGTIGLQLSGGSSVVRSLAIGGFPGDASNGAGIAIDSNGSSIVEGCYLGIDSTGTAMAGNGMAGVYINSIDDNQIGGSVAAARNIISGNDNTGVIVAGAGAFSNRVYGNYIGTAPDGLSAVANGAAGMGITGDSNFIGGTSAGQGNIVSGNTNNGVSVSGTGNLIQANSIGLGSDGSTALGNRRGVALGGSSNTLGGTVVSARNIVSDSFFEGVGMSSTTDQLIQGNYIGTNAAGTVARGNGATAAVYLWFSDTCVIGGTAAGAGNLISGNTARGVEVHDSGCYDTVIQGNFIGTNATGTATLENGWSGIGVFDGVSGTLIGGDVAGAGNLISGNRGDGVWLYQAGATVVQGNLIGTDATGTVGLGNNFSSGNAGVTVEETPGATIGGATADARNVISYNANGIYITGATASGNVVQGNYIGTDISGTLDLGNFANGIRLTGSAAANTIGGTGAGEGNLVSGNTESGIYLVTMNNIVQGNLVGTQADGVSPLGNDLWGIYAGISSNEIGGVAAGAGNTIAFNAYAGVMVAGSAVECPILGNSIFGNLSAFYAGIDLSPSGVTANDADDWDFGANNLQNFPELQLAEASGAGNLEVTYLIDSLAPNSTYPIRFELFLGDGTSPPEGRTFLASDSYTSADYSAGSKLVDLGNAAALGVSPGDILVATATDANGNTSEFSAGLAVATPLPAPTQVSVDAQPCGSSITTPDTSPTLAWSDVANETGYDWQVWDGPGCTGSMVDSGSTIADTTSDDASSLVLGQYSWQVRALGDGVAYLDSPWTCGCAFSIGGRVELIDDAGQPATLFLENGRAYQRVTDPWANSDPGLVEQVVVTLSTTYAADLETITLDETDVDTGIFEGSIELALPPTISPDGMLQTGNSGGPGWTYDTIAATYGSSVDTAMTAGSLTDFIDANGDDASSFPAGGTVYLRVRDQSYNDPLAIDTVSVELASLTTGDDESLVLSETGYDTGVFEGSIPSQVGVANDGDSILQVVNGETVQAIHFDANYPTQSLDTAVVAASATEFIDAAGNPATVYLESSTVYVRVIDSFANGNPTAIDTTFVDLSTLYGADTETVMLSETGDNTGVFEGSIELELASPGTPANGILETFEQTAPVFAFDTITAEHFDIAGSSTDTAQTIGSSTYLRNELWADTDSYAVSETVYLEVHDQSYNDPSMPDTVLVDVFESLSGDFETVTLDETGKDTGVFRGSITTESNPASFGDGILQVMAGGTITANHMDYLLFSFSADTATVSQRSVYFIDAAGVRTSTFLENGRAYVRIVDPAANSDPGMIDWVDTEFSSLFAADLEGWGIIETGPDTGIFEGSLDLDTGSSMTWDGHLQTGNSGGPEWTYDTITAITITLPSASDSASIIGSLTELIDAYGNDATVYPAGGMVYVRVRDQNYNDPLTIDDVYIDLASQTSGDDESFLISETGYDTGIFEGWIITASAPPSDYDGVLQVAVGETISAFHYDANYPTRSEDTAIIGGSATELIDAAGNPTTVYLESSTVFIRVTDSFANGDPGSVDTTMVDLSTLYGADTETIVLGETGDDTGVFEGSIELEQASPSTPANGILETYEQTLPIFEFDTITAEHFDIVGSSTDTAQTIGSYTYLRNELWTDTDSYAVSETVYLEVHDQSYNDPTMSDTVMVDVFESLSGDFESIALAETGKDTGVFRGSITTESNPTSYGDGILQVMAGGTITASHMDSLLFSFSEDTATVSERSVYFIDAAGVRTSTFPENGTAYVRIVDPAANSDPGMVDWVSCELSSFYAADFEGLTFNETGPDTDIFEGAVDLDTGAPIPWDGLLQTSNSGGPELTYDTITATTVTLPPTSGTASIVGSFTAFIDAYGNEVTGYPPGGTVYLQVQDQNLNDPILTDTADVTVESPTTGDSETLTLTETGLDTGIFEGSLSSEIAAAAADGVLQVTTGETIHAFHFDLIYPTRSEDTAVMTPPCSGQYQLLNNTWKQIALPCNPVPATVADVFGDDGIGVYGTDWAMIERIEATDTYRQLLETDILVQGDGYWIEAINGDHDIGMEGEYADESGPFEISVLGGPAGRPNQVGHPFTFPVEWAEVMVDVGGGTFKRIIDLSAAEASMILMSAKWEYNGVGYDMCDPRAVCGAPDDPSLDSFDGFWVKAFVDTTLRIPPTAMNRATPGPGSGAWWVRLTVASLDGSLFDRSNLLGRLNGAADGQDSLDGEDMPPFGGSYLVLVFPHDDWLGDAWSYTADYRQVRRGAGGSWSFEVVSDSAREITLSWQTGGDAADILARSRLLDLDNGTVIEPGSGGSTTLNVIAGRHHFTWIVDSLPQVDAGPDLQGGPIELVAAFTDEDVDDSHTATISWGDGTVDHGAVNPTAGTVSGSHVYGGSGSWTVEVCVTDEAGFHACDTLTATVASTGLFADGFESGDTSRWSVTRSP